jgi:predicted GNAT family acetyltransferase
LDQQQHYRLTEDGISPPLNTIPGELWTATNDDIAGLLPDYFAENYHTFEGEERTKEQCKASLEHFVEERMLLTYRYKGHHMAVLTLREVTGKIAQVTGQYTVSSYRNRGFGPALLYEAVEHLLNERGYEDVIVAASSQDEATNSVYWKLGFEPSEIMATYGIDAR